MDHVWSCRARQRYRHLAANMILNLLIPTMDGPPRSSRGCDGNMLPFARERLSRRPVVRRGPTGRTVGRTAAAPARTAAGRTTTTIPPQRARPRTCPPEHCRGPWAAPASVANEPDILLQEPASSFTNKRSQNIKVITHGFSCSPLPHSHVLMNWWRKPRSKRSPSFRIVDI